MRTIEVALKQTQDDLELKLGKDYTPPLDCFNDRQIEATLMVAFQLKQLNEKLDTLNLIQRSAR